MPRKFSKHKCHLFFSSELQFAAGKRLMIQQCLNLYFESALEIFPMILISVKGEQRYKVSTKIKYIGNGIEKKVDSENIASIGL